MKPSVVITGSEGGIGIALCNAFVREGYNVIGCDVAAGKSPSDIFIELNLLELVGSDQYREGKLSEIRKQLPSGLLNCLINNAAIQELNSVENLTISQWKDSIDVNLSAPFVLSQGLLASLKQASGSIINISSIHSRLTKPGFVSYATTKAGLDGLTRALSVELGNNIRVNSIAPAATETPMLDAGFESISEAKSKLSKYHPIGRIASASEIAEVALFLASAKSSFITGEVINVDGGIGSRLHDPD